MLQTALEFAFGRAGGPSRADARFDIAIAEYLNNGGTIDRAHERVAMAAEKLARKGRLRGADKGHVLAAPARQDERLDEGQAYGADDGQSAGAPVQPTESSGEGRPCDAENGPRNVAPPLPTNADDGGQACDADKGQNFTAAVVREPSAAQIAAAAKVRKLAAQSIFDRETTHTGRKWGNVTYVELDGFQQDADIALAVKHYIGELPRGKERMKTIRELMTPTQFAAAIRKAKKDAA